MRNSPLVERPRAENPAGLSVEPNPWAPGGAVGERARQRRRRTVRAAGAPRRENAGVSSEMGAGIPHAERPRFPGEGSSALGKPGPKARPKGVADGRLVEIPAPAAGVTERRRRLAPALNGLGLARG